MAYGYRHGFATEALANGVPDAQGAALLGHAETAMLHRMSIPLSMRAEARVCKQLVPHELGFPKKAC
jgi:integrase